MKKKISTSLLMFLILIQLSIGQTKKIYNGNFNSKNFQGSASYQYYEDSEQQRIFDGQFTFSTPTNSVNISGFFQNNLKSGQWKFIFTNIANTDILMNCMITATVSGAFDHGNLTNSWTLNRTKVMSFSKNGISDYYQTQLNALSYLFDGKKIDFNKSSTVTEFSIANFMDNHFIGTFSYSVNGGKSKVSGQFNEFGYFNGTWTITYYQDGILHYQIREYLNGVLLSIKNKDNSTGEVKTIFDETIRVNAFFQNYNVKENSSKIGDGFLKLTAGKSYNGDIPFLEDAISIWYNNSSLSNSAYIFEIEKGSNKLTINPERLIVNNEEKIKEAEQVENEKLKLEQLKKEQLDKEESERLSKLQDFQNSDYGRLQQSIRKEFNIWLAKSDFETSSDYENRIKNQADEKFKNILNDKKDKAKKLLKIRYASLSNYNPNNETFPVIWNKSDTAFVNIPKAIAPAFYNKFSNRKGGFDQPSIYIIPSELTMLNNKWQFKKAVILFDGFWQGGDFVRESSFKFISEGGKYFYDYDSYGLKRYSIINIQSLKTPSDIANEVYYYEWSLPSSENAQSLDFTYQDLNIILPK